VLYGRTYSKPITWQNDVTSAPIGGLLSRQFISSPVPLPTPKPYVKTWIGDPSAAPVVTATTTTAPIVLTNEPQYQVQDPIIRIGDPTATPIITPLPVMVTNEQQPRLTQVIVEQNFPDQTVPSTPTPPPLVVNNCFDTPPPRGLAILSAAAAEVFFSGGAMIATFSPPRYTPPALKIFYNPTDTAATPTTTTAQSVIVDAAIPLSPKAFSVVKQAPFDPTLSTTTTQPVVVDFIARYVTTNFVKVYANPAAPAVSGSDVFGSLGPTDVIGVIRITSVMSPGLRVTSTYSPTRLSRVAGVLRSTISYAVTRATGGRITSRSSTSSNDTRNTGVK
jgi:hypothetical protein